MDESRQLGSGGDAERLGGWGEPAAEVDGQRRITSHFHTALLAVMALAVAGGLASAIPAGPETADGRPPAATTCELFSTAGADEETYQEVGTDEDGMVWVIADERLFYWAGGKFRDAMPGVRGFGSLIGGNDRAVYANQRGKTQDEGLLYRLRDGEAMPECSYYAEGPIRQPPLYVSRSGRLFNWGNRYLAARRDGEWERIEAPLSQRNTLVFDLGDEVYFYYEGVLYCADATGDLHQRTCPQQTPAERAFPVHGTLWGDRRALLIRHGDPALSAFDLPTGKGVDLAPAFGELKNARFRDALTLKNGDVWLLGPAQKGQGHAFYRLPVDGPLVEAPETRRMPWNHGRIWQHPRSILETTAGNVIFGLDHRGIAVCRNGALSVWDWRYGLTRSVCDLCEDESGDVWFPTGGKVVRMHVGAGPPPASPLTGEWEEFPLVAHTDVWQLAPGEVAMFRKDHPKALSRWNGREWRHQALPFETAKVDAAYAVDDRGHLLIESHSIPDGHFDVGPDSVERFRTMEALLQNAVADGAREFPFVAGFTGIVATPDGQIWFGHQSWGGTRMFDGRRWERVPFGNDMDSMRWSPTFGLLFRTRGGTFCRYDKGQVHNVPPRVGNGGELMLTGSGLWPYERNLVETQPGSYLPVYKHYDTCIIFLRPDDFESACRSFRAHPLYASEGRWRPPDGVAAVAVSEYVDAVRKAPSGGAWVVGPGGAGTPLRVLDGAIRAVPLDGTPLVERPPRNVLEDGAGNLWFRTAWPAWYAYRKSGPEAR